MPTEYEVLRRSTKILREYSSRTRKPTRGDRAALNQLARHFEEWADRLDSERMVAPPGSEEVVESVAGSMGGKMWKPQPGVTFLVDGAFVRTFIELEPGPIKGMVGIDVQGKWNHGARDTLSMICHTEVAREFGEFLGQAAHQAPTDAENYRKKLRDSL